MKKAISCLLVALMILLAVMNSFADSVPIIHDQADLLSEDEESELCQVMNPICSYCIPVFWSTNEEDKTATMTKAQEYLKNIVGDDEGIIFVIDMYNRQLVICSTNQIYRYVTTAKCNKILDNHYKKATQEKYLECAKCVYTDVLCVLNGDEIPEGDMPEVVGEEQVTVRVPIDLKSMTVDELNALRDAIMEELNARSN